MSQSVQVVDMLAKCPEPVGGASGRTARSRRTMARGAWERKTVVGLRVRVRTSWCVSSISMIISIMRPWTIGLKGFFTLIQGYTRIGYSQASALR